MGMYPANPYFPYCKVKQSHPSMSKRNESVKRINGPNLIRFNHSHNKSLPIGRLLRCIQIISLLSLLLSSLR